MSRRCDICGKGPMAGRTISRRGLAKKKGGVGKRTTRVNKRVFLPNLHSAKAVISGVTKRIKVCAKCLKKGGIVKAA